MLHLAEKAFWPGPAPVPGDARRHRPQLPRGHRLPRRVGRRARRPASSWRRCRSRSTRAGSSRRPGPRASRNRLQTITLLDAIEEHGFDAVFGGARRDEEKARAKERVFSLPRRVRPVGPEEPAARAVEPLQRPAPQGRAHPRVPALELDRARHLAVHRRRGASSCRRSTTRTSARCSGATACCWRSTAFVHADATARSRSRTTVRYRTVGDVTCTGAVESTAATVDEVIAEVAASRITERGATRADDQFTEAAHGRPQARGLLLMELLRFATAGSVDDGKSHAHRAPALRLEADLRGPARGGRAHEHATAATSTSNLALLTDGLRAEREQGITIDVAYRYFATPQRKFIIADTPGHVQYTRNMVTGASTADLALILVDARKGVARAVPPPRVPRVAARRPAPRAVRQQDGPRRLRPGRLRARSRPSSATSRPSSTSTTSRSSRSRRCTATTSSTARRTCRGTRARRCCTTSRTCTSRPTATSSTCRFPVQYVIRPQTDEHHDYRGYAGTVAGGVLQARRRGRRAAVRVHHRRSRAIDTSDGPVDEAFPPMSVTIRLADDLDVSRGDMICRPHNQPTRRPGHRRDGLLDGRARRCAPGAKYAHQAHDPHGAGAGARTCTTGSTSTRCTATRTATTLALNEIGRVTLRTTAPLFFDEYRRNRATGSFILIDEAHQRHRRRRA